ncbi:MAG: hypothetical protein ACFFD1_16365, partial [Candidatus Thorarchaeota archaeon]
MINKKQYSLKSSNNFLRVLKTWIIKKREAVFCQRDNSKGIIFNPAILESLNSLQLTFWNLL